MDPRIRRVVAGARHPVRIARRLHYRRHGFKALANKGINLTSAALGIVSYQPLYGVDDGDAGHHRSNAERWSMLEPHLPPTGAALDIGAQNGWFTFKLAERGLFAIGIDVAGSNVRLTQWLSILNEPGRAAFMHADINPSTARQLPSVDVVLCLSVFHHWVRHHGLDYAADVMQALSGRCQHMFFETGQPNETQMHWAGDLAFMGDEPKLWIEEFLRSLGFVSVKHLGVTPGYRHKGLRHLMLASH